MIYDKEDLLFDVVSKFTNNLNTEITAINTEKADSITLDTLETNAFFVQSAGEERFNYSPYIFFYMATPETESIDSSSMDLMSIRVLVLFEDEAIADYNLIRKLLRYQRALKQTAENNFEISAGSNRMMVSSLDPVVIEDQDSNVFVKAVGIELQSYIN